MNSVVTVMATVGLLNSAAVGPTFWLLCTFVSGAVDLEKNLES